MDIPANASELIKKYTESRPWGKFEQFTHDQITTVKIITINPNQSLSLQYHHHRQEFWRVISGSGQVTIGDQTYDASPGDEFYVKVEQNHRLQGGENGMQVLEIAFGKFDENDIVRLEDKYNRV